MATSLDMSLEDRIKNRNSSERGRGRGRGRGWVRGRGGTSRGRAIGMLHQGFLRVNTHPSAFKTAKNAELILFRDPLLTHSSAKMDCSSPIQQSFSRAKDMIWRHDLFHDSMVAAGLSRVESGTKLYVSNLDYGVSNEDIKELFSEVGDLKRSALHYDRNGRPSGSAEVIFIRRSDALAALKRYNNVQLDGKAMKIEIIGSDIGLPVSARVQVGVNGRGRRTVVMTPSLGRGGVGNFNVPRGGRGRGAFQPVRGRGTGRGFGRGGGRGGRGRGRKPRPVEKSAVELDKELENYHAEAMNTS